MREHEQHQVRDTSIASYLLLPSMGDMQRRVYNCILEFNKKNICPTDREIAVELSLKDPNNVRPRRFELMKAGIVAEAGKRTCFVSKRLALTWRAIDVKPELIFDGDLLVQTSYISPERWKELKRHMEDAGYVYIGEGKWKKQT